MMFMAKSALCIGLVSLLALGATGGGDVHDAVASGSREAAAGLGRACMASQDCVGLGSRIVSAAIGQPDAVPDGIVRDGMSRASDALAPLASAGPAAPGTPQGSQRGEGHGRRSAVR